jgi:WD40 repeat protein/Tfp pilus assembly protein PilF
LTAATLLLLLTVAIGSTAAALWLGEALNSSEESRGEAERANADANAKLWDSYVSEARAFQSSRRVGQRFAGLQALRNAQRLPLPPGRSPDELRNATIACLALPDVRPVHTGVYAPKGNHVCFDGNLERYACINGQGRVRVRRVADGREIASLRGPGGGGPLLSADGRFVAVWSAPSARLKWWQLNERAALLIRELEDVRAFTMSPDSRMGAVARGDGTVALYDLANGQNLRQMGKGVPVMPLLTQQLAFHPYENRLAVGRGTAVDVLDLETGKVRANLPQPEGAYALAWHPDGGTLAVAGSTDVYLWNVAARKRARVLRNATRSGGIALLFSRRGDLLLTCEWSGTLRLWDPGTGQALLSTPGGFWGGSFSADDCRIAGFVNGVLGIWEIGRPQAYRTLPRALIPGKVYGAAFLRPDGRLLAVATDVGVALWDLLRREQTAFLRTPATDVLLEPSGALLTQGAAGLLRWPVREGRPGQWQLGPPQRLAQGEAAGAVAQSRDGRVLANAQFPGAVVLHRDRPGQAIRLGPHHDVRSVAVSPEGRWVATGSFSHTTVKVWRADSGRLVHTLRLDHGLCAVCFSPDGKWLTTGGFAGGACRLWAVGSWREKAGPRIGWGVSAFTPDGKWLAVQAGDRGTLALVHVATGRELARLEDPNQDRATGMTFSPDGTQLVTWARDDSGDVHIWDLRAIRRELGELGLDWDAPPLPAARGAAGSRLRVTVQRNQFLRTLEADLLVRQASAHSTKKEHDSALAALREAVETDPNHALAHNNLAWLLLTGPGELRDAAAALPLARRAVELAPKQFLYDNTLGVALYRTARFADAVPVLKQSLKEAKGRSDGFDLFFLAMCHHRLGEAVKARHCRDQAVQWLDKSRASLPANWLKELTEFRAEADAVLAQPAGSGKAR